MASPAKMNYRFLGNTGLLVSTFSLGCMSFDGAKVNADVAYDIMVKAFQAGVNFFDNAELYGAGLCETIMGQCIQRGIDEGVWSREDLVISTKIFFGTKMPPKPNSMRLTRKHIIEGMKASLKRIGSGYVDLVFCHRQDLDTPIEETVRAMNYVINQGWALYWGTSEWTASAIQEACDIADRLGMIRPAFDQPEFHIFQRSRVDYDYINLYKKYKYGLTTFSPLFGGLLAGIYNNGIPQGSRFDKVPMVKSRAGDLNDKIEKVKQLTQIAEEIGATIAQFSITSCAVNKHVSTVMVGASSVHQLEENLKAIPIVTKITSEFLARVEEIVQFQPTIDSYDKINDFKSYFPSFTD